MALEFESESKTHHARITSANVVVQCKNGSDGEPLKLKGPYHSPSVSPFKEKISLFHYWRRSVYEQLIKKAQSIGSWKNPFNTHYDDQHCANAPYIPEYDEVYLNLVDNVLFVLNPLLKYKHPTFLNDMVGENSDYELHYFFLGKVSLGQDWCEDAYVASSAEVRAFIANKTSIHGLSVFESVGFFKLGHHGCWRFVGQSLDNCVC